MFPRVLPFLFLSLREGKEREEPRGLKLIIDPYSSHSFPSREREENPFYYYK